MTRITLLFSLVLFLCKVDEVCHLEEIRDTDEKTKYKHLPLENHNAGIIFCIEKSLTET